MGIDDKIERVKDKLQKTPVNKATEKERGRLKARIAQLEEEKEKRQSETGGGYDGYAVEKTGDATISLVGYPSVGKSTLLNQLTNADSEVGEYQFTTLKVVPGILQYRGAHIQLLDVPGLIGGAAQGKGDGKQVISVVRNSDLVVLMTDPGRLDGFEKMANELYDAGIRVNSSPPDIKVTKRGKGGIDIRNTVELEDIDDDTIAEIMEEWGYVNATITIREEVTLDEIIDVLAGNREYMPAVRVVNKADQLTEDERDQIRGQYPDAIFISAEAGENLEAFNEAVFEGLGLMKIYLKEKGKDADTEEPLILQRGSTIEEACANIHDDFLRRFKSARVWGGSAKHPGQRVGTDHMLQDEDTLEINLR